MKPAVLALIDSNNFFVSCERLFRPDLEGIPVVVLSSNDGCAVSRSQEAKDLGIPMGAPHFQWREFFKRHGVVAFSANFGLYGDISDRITNLLTSITPHIEVYSVDESFLDLDELGLTDYENWGRGVRSIILKHVGIPVSIGIAPSKTLAKAANHYAKKHFETGGVVHLDPAQWGIESCDSVLSSTPVEDVWGVGWRLAPKLRAEGVATALQLRDFSPGRAGQLMGVHGRQLVAELGGIQCHPLQRTAKPQQTIMRGRQFGQDSGDFPVLESAIASLTTRAAGALRRSDQLACSASVILRTNPRRPGYQKLIGTVSFPTPTADTGIIGAALAAAAENLYNPRELYHKADVLLFDLIPQSSLQIDLLGEVVPDTVSRSQARLRAVDALNGRFGPGTIRYGAENLSNAWRPRHYRGSPRYTSDWSELPEAHII